jgi:predicted membrane chloride channel (bestrophin family)
MKYNVITITKRNDKWFTGFNKVAFNRVHKKPKPNPSGFYYFQEKLPVEQAFKELKDIMIKSLKERIDELTKSLAELEKLELT